jgi:squalene cyclase
MKNLRYDAVSYVRENGNAYQRLKLAHILGLEEEYQTLIEELMSLQNGDGGWPWLLEAGNPSGVSDTAKVLELLPGVGVEPASQPIRKALSYLLDHQNDDGGWSESPELEGLIPREWTWVSTVYSGYQTADALNALFEVRYSGDATVKALDFLRATQNEEGGWYSSVRPRPNPVTDIATTDHIVHALLKNGEPRESAVIQSAEGMLLEKKEEMDAPVDIAAALSCLRELAYRPENEHVRRLVDYLIGTQRPDGGWNWFGDLPSNPSQTVDCLVSLEGLVKIAR